MCLVLLLLSGAVGMKISTYGSGVSTGRTNKFHRVTTQPKTNLKITIIKCFCISFAVNVHGLDSNDMKESMVICYCKAKMIWALTQVAQRSLGDVLSSNYSHCEFVRKLLLHLQFEHSEFSLTSLLHEKKITSAMLRMKNEHIQMTQPSSWLHCSMTYTGSVKSGVPQVRASLRTSGFFRTLQLRMHFPAVFTLCSDSFLLIFWQYC